MTFIEWDYSKVSNLEIEAAIGSLQQGYESFGKNVKEAELEFAKHIGCRDAILVCNGTAALLTILFALREKYPDIRRVAVPSFTFIASYNAVKTVFPEITLVDCDLKSWNVCPENIFEEIDLLLLVDVGGQPCIYSDFLYGDYLCIGDSAESLGSTFEGKQVGSQLLGHVFSFQRSKIISCGEGGMITTNDLELSEICRSIMNHGYAKDKKFFEYRYDRFGLNFRLNDIQAAILRIQLSNLDSLIVRRREVALRYESTLKDKFGIQEIDSRVTTNRFFFGILLEGAHQEKFANHMLSNRVKVKCWSSVANSPGYNGPLLPNSDFLSERNVLLPIHNHITDSEVERVIDACLSF
jgi:perosamine synthetase